MTRVQRELFTGSLPWVSTSSTAVPTAQPPFVQLKRDEPQGSAIVPYLLLVETWVLR